MAEMMTSVSLVGNTGYRFSLILNDKDGCMILQKCHRKLPIEDVMEYSGITGGGGGFFSTRHKLPVSPVGDMGCRSFRTEELGSPIIRKLWHGSLHTMFTLVRMMRINRYGYFAHVYC